MDDDAAPFTRAQARAGGLSDRQLTRRLASGALIADRRGVLRAKKLLESGRKTPIPLEVQAVLLANPSRLLIVSHSTAARILRLPRPLDGWPDPQFTATSGSTRQRNGIQIKVAALTDPEIVQFYGVALTSPARTVADCLRTFPPRDSLAIVDAALHRGLLTSESVLETLHHQAGWPGVAGARQVLALADGRRESPLESWSAWAFSETGVPAPVWQVDIHESNGQFIGRGDCWWGAGVIGEADGRSKYALAAAEHGGDPEAVFRVLQAERRREQRIRDVGGEVVRWSAGEVLKPAAARHLSDRITVTISRAQDGARFTGVVAPAMLPVRTARRPDSPPRGT